MRGRAPKLFGEDREVEQDMATVLGCNLRLTDVHITAEAVGRELKELTDKFGMECTTGLVPPVVEALERLETYVEGYQHLQTRLSRLQLDHDTVVEERAQKARLAEENKNLSVMVGELKKQNNHLLMEMDELHFKNKDLSSELSSLQTRLTELEFGETMASEIHCVIEDAVLEPALLSSSQSPSPPPPPPRPHSPHRVVRLSQGHAIPPGSHSPSFSPSPSLSPSLSIPASPTPDDSTHTPLSHNHTAHTPPSHNHTAHTPPSHNHTAHTPPSHNHTAHTPPSHNHTAHTPPSHNHTAHTPPSHNHTAHTPPSHNHTAHTPPSHNHTAHTPPSHNHTAHTPPSHNHTAHTLLISNADLPRPMPYFKTPPAVRVRTLLPSVERSSSMSDMAGVRGRLATLATPKPHQEDMLEKSRITKRLRVVEEELQLVTRQLRESQQSKQKTLEENSEMKIQLERFKAEDALRKIDLSKKELQKAEETPRYYKEEMMRVLTDRNRLKETVASLQEELDSFREALRNVAANGVEVQGRKRTGISVRSILSESLSLDSYISHTQPTSDMVSPNAKHQHNGLHK